MQLKNKVAAVIIILAAAVSILIPVHTLFFGEGFLVNYIKTPESAKMLAEIGLLFLISGAVFYLIKDRRKQAAAAAVLAVVFCWLHVVFLPMVISALYLGFLILAGRFLKEYVFKIEDRGGYPADFMLGSSAVILCFCLLSAAGIGRIPVMRLVCLGGGSFFGAFYGVKWRFSGRRLEGRQASGGTKGIRETGQPETAGKFLYPLCFTFILTAVLIQAGRMNIALDFDTLWYGVRSEYILAGGGGIYENPGMVGMVYVYSKGLEVLTLPLADLASHSYLLFFTLWLTVMGLTVVYRIALLFMRREYAVLAAALCASLPGIMNMGISAKPDIITWLLQLIILEYFFRYAVSTQKHSADADISNGMDVPNGTDVSDSADITNGTDISKGNVPLLLLAAGAYLLSLTMKPTSLVFSTAIFGMMGLYLIFSKRLSFKAPARRWAVLFLPGAALIGIWGRTMMITGMPVTSVFTSIFAKMGFEMKYPFATGSLPQNWQDESNLHVLLRRLWQILLSPEGKDMGHVIIAWGTSFLFFAAACIVLFRLAGAVKRKNGCLDRAAAVVFWPFLAVNMVSLIMLYQVDGNYFMLLYTFLILWFCRSLNRAEEKSLKKLVLALTVPLLIFNILVMSQTNWAWSAGFSEIQVLNKGRYNHRAKQHEDMIAKGNAVIWQVLSSDPANRVIAFGNHPFCLEFPCNVQSYKDITSPWGNVELVNSPEAFEEYMEYADTDYVYAEAGYIGTDSWEWSYGLLRDLIADGVLTDFFFENGNALARVSREKLTKEEAEANLRLFDENYITSDSVKQEVR